MTTLCPACKAPVAARRYLERPGDDPLFAETYGCGSVYLWGLVAAGAHLARPCPSVEGEAKPGSDPAATTSANG